MNGAKSYLKKMEIRASAFLLSFILFLQAGTIPAYGKPDWPSDTGIEGEAGIVVDEETGAVLFGQNIHVPYAPASITKLLTALVAVENCASLDDVVVFSHDAVYNVEEGSGNALALEEGDQLTVRDCLYALLLRSSNQAANALAEHIGGSRDGFVAMMNEKIRAIGCTESNFANPSGLNDENQFVSAYDMALIGRAAFQNETLLEIDSSTSYQLPATINNPEGIRVGMEHKMLITTDPESPNYYPAAVAGKTGFTSIALNTLVTIAREGERGQIAVILKSNQTHYSDTKALMDFGFQRFQNLDATGDEGSLFQEDQTILIGNVTYKREELEITGSRKVTVPLGATLADVERQLVTGEEISAFAPENTAAEIRYTYDGRVVGRCYFTEVVPEPEDLLEAGAGQEALGESSDGSPKEPETGETKEEPESQAPGRKSEILPKLKELAGGYLPVVLGTAAGLLLIFLIVWRVRKVRKARQEAQERRRERRRQRLAEIGYSEDDFKRMVEERYKRDQEN